MGIMQCCGIPVKNLNVIVILYQNSRVTVDGHTSNWFNVTTTILMVINQVMQRARRQFLVVSPAGKMTNEND